MTLRLVADIGGTNSRLALCETGKSGLLNLQTFLNSEFDSLEAVIAASLDKLETAPTQACLAIAAPLSEGEMAMANLPWRFSREGLRQHFGFDHLRLLNDFQAVGYALPHLPATHLVTISPGVEQVGKLAAMGPGTGLGGATSETINGTQHVTACEPGHSGLVVATELELDLLRLLQRQYDHVHVELLVSGPGIERIYLGLCKLHGQTPADSLTAAVCERALQAEEDLAVQALHMFCALLGSVCGDYLLHNGAFGGLYLAGGVLPRFLPFLQASEFHRRLCSKGVMQEQLAQVPVHAIRGGHPGLLGAAVAPMSAD